MPFSLAAAPIRTIHSERNCRLRCLRPEEANFNPRSPDSFAEGYSFDLVRKYPVGRSNIFLRFWRRLVPRFTRGMVFSFYVSLYGGWREGRFPLPATRHLFQRP